MAATFNESSAGVIAAGSSLTVTAGTTTLAGVNAYSGTTSINGGTLSLTGTIGSGTGTAITSGATFTQSSTGVIAGGSSLTVTAGTTSLAGVNSYRRNPGQRRNAEHYGFRCKHQQRPVYTGGTLSGSGVNASGTGLIGGAVAVNGGGTISLTSGALPGADGQWAELGNSWRYLWLGWQCDSHIRRRLGQPQRRRGSFEAIDVGTAGSVTGTVNSNSIAAYVTLTGTNNLIVGDTYSLINSGSPLTLSDFSLSATSYAGSIAVGVDTATLALSLNGDDLQLTISGTPTPNVAFFKGAPFHRME